MAPLTTEQINKGLARLPNELFDEIAELVLQSSTVTALPAFPHQMQINRAVRTHYAAMLEHCPIEIAQAYMDQNKAMIQKFLDFYGTGTCGPHCYCHSEVNRVLRKRPDYQN